VSLASRTGLRIANNKGWVATEDGPAKNADQQQPLKQVKKPTRGTSQEGGAAQQGRFGDKVALFSGFGGQARPAPAAGGERRPKIYETPSMGFYVTLNGKKHEGGGEVASLRPHRTQDQPEVSQKVGTAESLVPGGSKSIEFAAYTEEKKGLRNLFNINGER